MFVWCFCFLLVIWGVFVAVFWMFFWVRVFFEGVFVFVFDLRSLQLGNFWSLRDGDLETSWKSRLFPKTPSTFGRKKLAKGAVKDPC